MIYRKMASYKGGFFNNSFCLQTGQHWSEQSVAVGWDDKGGVMNSPLR